MAIKPSEGKLLYHITHIDNMQSILNIGLISRNKLLENDNDFVDIADPEIIEKRNVNNLSNYVLFHFFTKNPFDCAICHEYGSENMVIIGISRELHENKKFYIIPTHPLDININTLKIYSYEEGYSLIQWEILDMPTGRDYKNPEIKKACMAECLVEHIIQPEAFSRVFVYNEVAESKICGMMNQNKIKISINPNMFP